MKLLQAAGPAPGRDPRQGPAARLPVRGALLCLGVGLLLLGAGCSDEPPREEAIAAASADTVFASTEALGPHLLRTTLARTEERRSGTPRETEETMEVAWQDWDAFSVRRTSGGTVVIHNVVYGAVPYVRMGERWEQRDDAEPHRVQLRTTWDTWGTSMAPFVDHLQLTYVGDEVVHGRKALRYAVGMKPAEERPPPRAWGLQPQSLSGDLWLDEATAVRLKADVTAVSLRDGLERTTRLTLERSRFGEDLGLSAPELE